MFIACLLEKTEEGEVTRFISTRKMDPADGEAQAEEMEVLKSIYADDCILHPQDHSCEVLVYPSDEEKGLCLRLCIYFPDAYPSTLEPVVEMQAPWISERSRKTLHSGFHKLFVEQLGSPIVFTWIEWLKEQTWLWQDGEVWLQKERSMQSLGAMHTHEDSRKLQKETIEVFDEGSGAKKKLPGEEGKGKHLHEKAEEANLEELDRILGISHGAPFTEKKSTFQAHLAPVKNADQVETVMEALMRNRKVASATHNIMAYRISMPEKGTVLQDYDDDGENAAGGRLLHLLQIVDATDVVVVVSRWFGGILLGPDRFKHINNAARSILSACGYIKATGQSSTSISKTDSKAAHHKGRRR